MSTVSKKIADRVIAGEFPEDNCVCILKYKNIFNGEYAYKCVFSGGILNTDYLINLVLDSFYRINCKGIPTLYWAVDWLDSALVESDMFPSEFFKHRKIMENNEETN